MLRKAELHCHIEGAATPRLALALAEENGIDISHLVVGNRFVWHDFTSFLGAYDAVASLFRTPEDYRRLADDYLSDLARHGAIYSEFFVSPDHAERAGLPAKDYFAGLAEGMERARAKTGIESRMIVIGIRHFGVEAVEKAARIAARAQHPLIAGFGMAGEERFGETEDYVRAFEIAREAGLGLTVHAGEFGGPASIADALDHFRPARIGHGVRAIEDPELVRRIAAEGIVLECCPSSNVALGVYGDLSEHPFPALFRAGCRVTLNSDDPPFFETSLANEYDIAERHFGLGRKELAVVTRTAVEAAFVDRRTRAALLDRLDPPARK